MTPFVRWSVPFLACWLAACGDDAAISGNAPVDAVPDDPAEKPGLLDAAAVDISDAHDAAPSATDAIDASETASPTCVTGSACDDADPCTTDACVPTSGCVHTLTCTCGDGMCNAAETALNCGADCGFLLNRYAGSCPTPNSWAGCPDGYVCVARNPAAGGNICVADFENWQPIPDSHPASDFSEFTDYVVDNKTGLFWQKKSMNWTSLLPPCVTETAGGFNDWRLPTEGELLSLVDYNVHAPATSAPGFSLPDLLKKGYHPFGSATPDVDPVSGKQWNWGVDLGWDGSAGGGWFKVPSGRTQCVRSTSATLGGAGMRFAVEVGGQTFLDRMTGLHWQRGDGKVAAWQDAKNWCNGNLGGLPGSGWRLPTEGEFRQLANRQGNTQWLAVFTIVPATSWWTWGGWTSAALWSWDSDSTGNFVWSSGVQAWLVYTWPTQDNHTMAINVPSVATCVRP